MRQQPRSAIRGQLHVLAGVILIIAVLCTLWMMFRAPIVTEHEEIKRRTMQEARSMIYEWSPIETLKEMVDHQSPEFVLTMYRMVVYIILTKCEFDPIESLFESLFSVDYSKRKFSIDIHIEMRCPPAVSSDMQEERDKIVNLISSLRWTEGRVTGSHGPTIASVQEYIVNHWMPITNWEMSFFIEEGYVLSQKWFSGIVQAIEHFAISRSHSSFPFKKTSSKMWQLSYIIGDLTPKRFLGFSVYHDTSAVKKVPCYTVQRLGVGTIVFPAKWRSFLKDMEIIKKEIVSRKEEPSLNTVVENSMVKNNYSLIHIEYIHILRKLTQEKPHDVQPFDFPRLSQLPHFSLAENRIKEDEHLLDEDDWV